jgi:cell division protein FtsZ
MPILPEDSFRIHYHEETHRTARIKVIGVGGGGGNAVNRMITSGVEGVEFIAANTDLQALEGSNAPVKLQLGVKLTAGLGAGANPDIGRRAALEDSDKIIEALEGADLVFVTAGLGGGTGTGAAPVIASLASEMGALTIAVVTKPFAFEGKRRTMQADRGLQELLESVDTLIVIPNEKLVSEAADAGFFESFRIADDILRQGVQGITDIITIPGVINRDFADVKTTMAGMGYSVMGTAVRSGPQRAREAAIAAMSSPLLETGAITGARGILINITGSSSLKLSEVNEASSIIQDASHEDANIIFGAVLDETMGDDVKFTVIATGFREEMPARRERMMAGSSLPTARFYQTAPPSFAGTQSMPPRMAPPVEAPRVEVTPVEVPRVASARVESARIEVPAIETPRVEEPVVAAPVAPVPPPVVRAPFASMASEPVATVAEATGVSYYEVARQQARQEAERSEARRDEVAPPVIRFAEPVPEPTIAVTPHAVPAPVPVVQPTAPQSAPVVVERILHQVGDHFADRSMAAPAQPAPYAEASAPVHEEAAEPAASASVFDDAFFSQPKPEPEAHWPEAKIPSFAGYAPESESSDTDELDIPAFLRRKQ